MKILYFAYGTGSNISIHTERWLTYFARKGHDIHVLSDPATPIPGVKVHLFRRPYRWRAISNPLALLIFRYYVFKIKPDIVHAHYIYHYGFMSALSGFKPLVLTAWGTDIYKLAKKSQMNRLLTRLALRRADLVTGDSQDILNACIGLGASPEKTHLIINGVDSNVFYPHHDCHDLAQHLELRGRPVVISTRHFSPVYNIDIIVKAIPLVLRKCPSAVFILKNAYGNQEPELRKLVDELGVSEAVRFVGQVEYAEMARYLSMSDVFLSVPSWDSSSISMMEAMACGAVPIVADLPSAREWINDGSNGYLVPSKDHQILAERITRVIQDDQLRKEFRAKNLEIAKKADQTVNMNTMEDLYYSLLRKPST